MLDTELYIHKVKAAPFGGVLLDWVKSQIPSCEKEILRREQSWNGSLLNWYLRDVANIYVEIKSADISKISFGEDRLKIHRVCEYEYAPLSRTPFIILLYGMMIADDTCREHHEMNKKAGMLMDFLMDYNPKEAELVRNIVLYNNTTIPEGAWTEKMILDEAEAHLHPTISKMITGEHARQININVSGDLNIDKNFAPMIDNHNGGIVSGLNE